MTAQLSEKHFRDLNCDPRSEWTTQPATSAPLMPRLATAELSAVTARDDFIRSLIE